MTVKTYSAIPNFPGASRVTKPLDELAELGVTLPVGRGVLPQALNALGNMSEDMRSEKVDKLESNLGEAVAARREYVSKLRSDTVRTQTPGSRVSTSYTSDETTPEKLAEAKARAQEAQQRAADEIKALASASAGFSLGNS